MASLESKGRSGLPHWESSLKATFIPARASTSSLYSPSPTLSAKTELTRRSMTNNVEFYAMRQAELDTKFGAKNTMYRYQRQKKSFPQKTQSLSRVYPGIDAMNFNLTEDAQSSPRNIVLQGEKVLGNAAEGKPKTPESARTNALPNMAPRSHSFGGQTERPKTLSRISKSNLSRSDSYSSLPGLNILQLTPHAQQQQAGNDAGNRPSSSVQGTATDAASTVRSSSAEPSSLAKTRLRSKASDDGFRSKEDMFRALRKKLGTADDFASKRPQSVRNAKKKKSSAAQSLHRQWSMEGINHPYMDRPQSRIVRRSPGLRSIFLRPQDAVWVTPEQRKCPPNCDCCFKVALQPERPDSAATTLHNNSPMTSDDETKKSKRVQFSV